MARSNIRTTGWHFAAFVATLWVSICIGAESAGDDANPRAGAADAQSAPSSLAPRNVLRDILWEHDSLLSPAGERLYAGGYAMFDWANIEHDRPLETLEPEFEDGGFREVRDAQVSLRGRLTTRAQVVLQIDVNQGKVELADNYLQWDDVPVLGSIRLGHFKEPFGLENTGSLRYHPFMERSLVNVLNPGRGVGAAIGRTELDGRLNWRFGAFYETNSVETINEASATALTGRISGLPIYLDDGRELLHLGLSASLRFLDASMRFAARSESDLAPRYLDTAEFAADQWRVVNFEAAYKRGPQLIQSEFVIGSTSGAVRAKDVTLNDIADTVAETYPRFYEYLQNAGDSDRPGNRYLWQIPFDLAARGEVQFSGAYAQWSYVLTRETRPYDPVKAVFGPVVPENPVRLSRGSGWGAWEVAARVSYLDLEDGYIHGGRETNLSVGLNWYLNKNVRVMLNYIHGDVSREGIDGNVDVIQSRLQIEFPPTPVFRGNRGNSRSNR